MFSNEYKTVFHPEKGVKGMIQETFVTLDGYSQKCMDNSNLQMNLMFSLWDNQSLWQENNRIVAENQELLTNYIRVICDQIVQNYFDHIKYRIPEAKIRICKKVIALIHLCEEKQKYFNTDIFQKLKPVFEICYAIIKDLQFETNDISYTKNLKSCEDRLLVFFNNYDEMYLFDKKTILNIKSGLYNREKIKNLLSISNT